MEEKVMQEQLIGEGVGFERIRRITGYLVGTLDRFNDAKAAEELAYYSELIPELGIA